MKKWVVYFFLSSAVLAVDFNDPTSVTGQDFFLSFWRSGTNWLFTCIQAIARRPTRYIVKDSDGNFSSNACANHLRIPLNISKKPLYHTHSCAFVSPFSNSNRLLLIVRNYKEVIMRNVLDDSEAFAKAIEEEDLFDYYSEYLAIYDSWNPAMRLLIYYEDLLQQPQKIIPKVLAFLEEDADLEPFIKNYDQYRQKTIKSYHKQYKDAGGSMSKGQNENFHYNQLSKELQNAADKLMQTKYPALFERYLKRYLSPNSK